MKTIRVLYTCLQEYDLTQNSSSSKGWLSNVYDDGYQEEQLDW